MYTLSEQSARTLSIILFEGGAQAVVPRPRPAAEVAHLQPRRANLRRGLHEPHLLLRSQSGREKRMKLPATTQSFSTFQLFSCLVFQFLSISVLRLVRHCIILTPVCDINKFYVPLHPHNDHCVAFI